MILVRKSVHVAAPPERCFRTFTSELGRWWPLATHHIGAVPAKSAVIEPFVGGRWFERGEDGSECPWGRVLAWEPPARLLLTWEITADWKADAALHTEVEVTFAPEGAGTRVDLVHRHLEAYGPAAETMRGIFESDGGWTALLASFAHAAEG